MTDNTIDLPKAYEPGLVERKWYDFWMNQGYFTPKIDYTKKPFVVIQPPPNITGDLHLGHAITATLEDIMVRWHRMMGEPTLWLPGEDHAGIAAQMVVERAIAKEGFSRATLGREKFMERMWQWVNGCRANIGIQHRRLGVSCDWTRERFTLDPGPSKAVRTFFVRLYEKGLIYRGERIINWCPRCSTALSDLEVEHDDVAGNLWHLRYPLEDNSGFVHVATTRPETMLGDTAVAVNPGDVRYKAYIGKRIRLPLVGRIIPIVADDSVSMEFGTGAVKVTPAHDPNDFEIGTRHNLPIINIFNNNAVVNENGGNFCGMDRLVARKAVITSLGELGLLERVETHTHAVGHCQRCRTVVEPLVSRQWFVKIGPLAAPAIAAVKNGEITILPEKFAKVYLNWMENIRDWCISRQLWWGHRIPVWYCECGETIVSTDDPNSCLKCASSRLVQDPDVLDTWFSSGLWTHSTLGWPDNTEDLRYFYPTTVMETAYDILFFWVARMIMMGIENTGQVPFRYVYLHGLIRDEKGDKMSKTTGNVVDPLKVIDQYGADALRFAVISGITIGNDSKLSPTKLEAGRNFANKLWNATRFVLRYSSNERVNPDMDSMSLALEDRWIVSRLQTLIVDVDSMLQKFELGEALRSIHDFLWGEYCDWYIEICKARLATGVTDSPLPVLVSVLESALKLLHPFMPFVTEELWQSLKKGFTGDGGESIMVASYPKPVACKPDVEAEAVMGSLIEIMRAIRNVRAEYEVEQNRIIEAIVYAGSISPLLDSYTETIERMARTKVGFAQERVGSIPPRSMALALTGIEVVISMDSLFDVQLEKERVGRELEEATREMRRLEALLRDESFCSKAPAVVVEKQREKMSSIGDRISRMREHLSRLDC